MSSSSSTVEEGELMERLVVAEIAPLTSSSVAGPSVSGEAKAASKPKKRCPFSK